MNCIWLELILWGIICVDNFFFDANFVVDFEIGIWVRVEELFCVGLLGFYVEFLSD